MTQLRPCARRVPRAHALLALLAFVACALGALALPSRAQAVPAIDQGAAGSLSVTLREEAGGIAGVTVRLLRAGDVGSYGSPALAGDFAAYPVSLEDLDASGWRAAAQTLASYAERDQLEPVRTGETDADGGVRFAGLGTGLYLVVCDARQTDAGRLDVEPALVTVPALEEGAWSYDVLVEPKFETVGEGPGTVDVTARKVWEGGEAERSESVTVQLLRDGEVWDEAALDAKGEWRHVWAGLDAAHRWAVVEKDVPEGFEVSVDREGLVFTVTNTGSDEPGPAPEPEGSVPSTGDALRPAGLLLAAGAALVAVARLVKGRG